MLASFVLGVVGLYMLLRGKKTAQPGLMVAGGALLVLSYVLF